MRDELTCWDYVPEFTGQQAALAIVGEPQTDDPATPRKAMPVLDLMRRAYEGTRRWFADAPEDDDTAPRGLLVSVEMQAVKARVAQLDDVVADHPYCVWPRTSEHVSLLFDGGLHCVWPRKTEHVSLLFPGELQRKGGQDSNLSDADTNAENWRYNFQDWRFLTWLRTPMADFDRQTFTRDVLARWTQEVGASSLYPFAGPLAQSIKTPRPMQRQAAQELAILEAIRQAGCDPLRLPRNTPGKAGIKAQVRKALNDDPMFTGTTVFNGAWERLSASGDIASTD